MYCELSDTQLALRNELREYFERIVPRDLEQRFRGEDEVGPHHKEIIRKIGRDGYLAVGWPKEYGGRGFGPVEQLIFVQEAQRAGVPVPQISLGTVGPALMIHGSPEQRERFLPGIAAGELTFAVGYTEPTSGTDLASLRTKAELIGDHFVVNGSKIFTSGAEVADFIWLAVRTDPDAPKHKGISMLIVDTKSPGFSYTPIRTVANLRTNATYYSDVRVPRSMLVGTINNGWKVITSQLNYERIGIASRGVQAERLYRRTLEWANNADESGNKPIANPRVRRLLAGAFAKLETLRMMNYRLAWSLGESAPSPAFASAAKVRGVECMIDVYRDLLQVVGLGGLVRRGSEVGLLAGDLEASYRRVQLNSFAGGSNDVLRELIAQFGLGLPRTQR